MWRTWKKVKSWIKMEGEGNHFFRVVFHFILFPWLTIIKCFQKDFLMAIIDMASLDNAVVWIHSFLQPYVPISKRLKMKLMPKISRNLFLVFLHHPPKVTREKIPSDMDVAPRYTLLELPGTRQSNNHWFFGCLKSTKFSLLAFWKK